MPVTFHIDKIKKIVFSDATGELTAEDVRASRRSMLDDPDFEPHFGLLVDLQGITELRISAEEVRQLAMGAIFDPSARKALVTRRDLMFGVSRMFSSHHSDSDKTEVFRDIDEARRWLGLD